MKLFILIMTFCATHVTAFAADPVAKVIDTKIPDMKESSQVAYKRLKAGFDFKGYDDSPGHDAILAEMKFFYQQVQKFSSEVKGTDKFPEKVWETLEASCQKVEKLSGFVIMDEEVAEILEKWLTDAKMFVSSKKEAVSQVESTKAEIERKKQEELLAMAKQIEALKLAEEIKAKKQNLEALDQYDRMYKNQSEMISTGLYVPRTDIYHAANYVYSGGRYYPINQCPPHPRKTYSTSSRRPIINVTFGK